jgi:hypothetical protein
MGAHDDFQAQIVDAARIFGWSHLHVRKSIGRRGGARGWQTTTNVRGWPDLLLWHPTRGGALAVEVKVPPDRATPEQEAVLADLAASLLKSEGPREQIAVISFSAFLLAAAAPALLKDVADFSNEVLPEV